MSDQQPTADADPRPERSAQPTQSAAPVKLDPNGRQPNTVGRRIWVAALVVLIAVVGAGASLAISRRNDDAPAGRGFVGDAPTVVIRSSGAAGNGDDTTVVPARALIDLDGDDAVELVRSDGSLLAVPVVTGEYVDGWVEIVGVGLPAGARVTVG